MRYIAQDVDNSFDTATADSPKALSCVRKFFSDAGLPTLGVEEEADAVAIAQTAAALAVLRIKMYIGSYADFRTAANETASTSFETETGFESKRDVDYANMPTKTGFRAPKAGVRSLPKRIVGYVD